jgi:hypothetical protein
MKRTGKYMLRYTPLGTRGHIKAVSGFSQCKEDKLENLMRDQVKMSVYGIVLNEGEEKQEDWEQ